MWVQIPPEPPFLRVKLVPVNPSKAGRANQAERSTSWTTWVNNPKVGTLNHFYNMEDKMKEPKYKKGDVVGVCGDAMYEFKIIDWYEDQKVYSAECTRTCKGSIKVGEQRAVRPNQIVLKLS